MILTGAKLNASTAYDFGLVDIIADNALEEATHIAGIINSKPENTVKLAKRAVNNTSSGDIRSNLDYEAALFGILFSDKKTKESINHFIKKKEK
jgi:Enoyl-CoA hydratase/carnithine racemase